MHTPKVHKKFAKLPGAPTVFGKLRAALQSTGAFSASSEQAESVTPYEVTQEYRTNQLEAERLRHWQKNTPATYDEDYCKQPFPRPNARHLFL